MEYDPTAWFGFAATLGGVSGALTGLLFVSVSINSSALSRSRNLRFRAAQSLTLFMITVLISIILAAPQPTTPIGWELLALGTGSGTLMHVLGRRAGHASEPGAARYVERFSSNVITPLLVVIAGVTLLFGAGGGLYWVLPATIAGLVSGVVSSWLFLIQINDGSA